MSNEEYEKKIEFILEQQAQFAASIQEHNERFARNEELVGQIGERMIQLEEIVNRLAAATLAGFKDVNAKIDALIDSHLRLSDAQARTEEVQKRTEEALGRLAEAQARTEANQALTDEALRKLIATVDRQISERRNGEQKSDE